MSRSENPVSPEQRVANRANAARSTGTRTPEGKARPVQNALQHGLGPDFTIGGNRLTWKQSPGYPGPLERSLQQSLFLVRDADKDHGKSLFSVV
jgi:hypothetical protein